MPPPRIRISAWRVAWLIRARWAAPWGAFVSTKPHECAKFQHQNQQTTQLNHRILTFRLRISLNSMLDFRSSDQSAKGEARPDDSGGIDAEDRFWAAPSALALIATAAPALAEVPGKHRPDQDREHGLDQRGPQHEDHGSDPQAVWLQRRDRERRLPGERQRGHSDRRSDAGTGILGHDGGRGDGGGRQDRHRRASRPPRPESQGGMVVSRST